MPDVTLPIRTRGVLLRVLVRVRAEHGQAEPPAIGPIQAYLDTGASDTMLDHAVARALAAEPVRTAALNVLGREEASFHAILAVEVAVALGDGPPRWVAVDALAGPVYPTGAVAALGRDFLASVILSYDGPNRRARLQW